MKLYCPRCHSENDSETAQAGAVRCVNCERWFSEKGVSPWGQAPKLYSTPSRNIPAGRIIWPAVLAVVLIAGLIGFIPILWMVVFMLFAILGGIITFLAEKNAR